MNQSPVHSVMKKAALPTRRCPHTKPAMPTNISCAECRLAKVKCIRIEDGRGTPRCVRCTRFDLQCVTETRRSKWDAMRSETPDPAGLARDPLPIISAIDKIRSVSSTALHPCGYAAEQVLTLSLMIEAALERDDAQALAVATSSIDQFRLKPSMFAHALAGGKAHPMNDDLATNCGADLSYGSSTSGGGGRTCRHNDDEMESPRPATTPTTKDDGPHTLFGELPFALPPYMAAHYASETQVHTHARTRTNARTHTHARIHTLMHTHVDENKDMNAYMDI